MTFPFRPKSNSNLRPGYFWPIALSNGAYGCGIVLDIPDPQTQSDKRSFYLGILNWTSDQRPSVESLESFPLVILKQGHAHIKTITIQGEEILGMIDLEKKGLFTDLVVDSQVYSASSYVLKGFQTIRKATVHDHDVLETKSCWGYGVIVIKANKLLERISKVGFL